MPKIRLEYESYGGGKCIIENDDVVSLSEVLDQFEYLLKGAGFVFDGKLDIIPEEEFYGEGVDNEEIVGYPDCENDGC